MERREAKLMTPTTHTLMLSCRGVMLVVLLIAYVLGQADAIDDVLSYKSLVLGSLSSGERVSGRVRHAHPLRPDTMSSNASTQHTLSACHSQK